MKFKLNSQIAPSHMLLSLIASLGFCSSPVLVLAQEHAGHTQIPTLKPDLPRLGRAQEKPTKRVYTIAELEQMALEKNPTLAQAEAEIRTATAKQKQSGLYPNPTIGYTGEEIRGGSFGGGQQGFFISQTLVTGGKLRLNRNIFDEEIKISHLESEEQRLRVMNGVHLAYYRVLAAQEMLDARRDLVHIASDSVKTAKQLRNIGQADDAEILQAEIEEQQMLMSVALQENSLRQAWRELAAVIGNSTLEEGIVAGNFEKDLPALDEQQVLNQLLHESPTAKIAQSWIGRADAVVTREKREPVPDIQLRAGMQNNRELLEPTLRRVGWQGFAEIGIQLHIFNRNQGTIAAAQEQATRARKEANRVELVLRERFASVLESYHNARIMAERYRSEMLPRAQKAYELRLQTHGSMLTSYPQVLAAQRALFQMQTAYIAALDSQWMYSITLRGLLLIDALEAPARPGEVDLPIRETNVPVSPRIAPRM
ncbi:MAG: TolC family protein [Acidobacteria bacterium]|nr:TolC family protein [Acidobacteriota bacterium]